jgi:hypothetical protein
MKYRKLRIAWSVAWGVLCLLLVAYWAWSYSGPHGGLMRSTPTLKYEHYSHDGRLIILKAPRFYAPGGAEVLMGYPEELFSDSTKTMLKIGRYASGRNSWISVPYLLPVSVVLIFASLTWLPWSSRFSLRSLLIGITVVAVLLGLIAVTMLRGS